MNERHDDGIDLRVSSLGERTLESPLTSKQKFIDEHLRVLLNIRVKNTMESYSVTNLPFHSFEKAGPRKKIFFNPKTTRVAVVTCGGLCPGLNAIIRTVVRELWNRYEVRNIFGVKYGYWGLSNKAEPFVNLDPDFVEDIPNLGGTCLGTSRGTPPTTEIVDNLEKNKIDILFTIGGDGTMRGANCISQEIEKRKLKIGVIGIPKTIDNDIPFVEKSFGFETAVERASQAICAVHEEARGHFNGIGLIKIMGRNAGFIAATATLAAGVVDACLIPEAPFQLEGEKGLIPYLKQRFHNKKHAVVVVAEGAGQSLAPEESQARDASGNLVLFDIGLFLKKKVSELLKKEHIEHSLKYVDPSYTVRSAPPNCYDKVFCTRIAQNAVHAGMAGKSAMLIGYWHGEMTHVPFRALNHRTKKINPNGAFWFTIMENTTQTVR